MRISYTFTDNEHNGEVYHSPDFFNSSASKSNSIYELKGKNGLGKSWIMFFLLSSLVDDVSSEALREHSSFLNMSPELVEKYLDTYKRAVDAGELIGEVYLESQQLKIRAKFHANGVVDKEYSVSGGEWEPLTDTLARHHLRVLFLIPEEPTKRINKIEEKITIEIGKIARSFEEATYSLQKDFRDRTSNLQDSSVVEKLVNDLQSLNDKQNQLKIKVTEARSLNANVHAFNSLTSLVENQGLLDKYQYRKSELENKLKAFSKQPSRKDVLDAVNAERSALRDISQSKLHSLFEELCDLGSFHANRISDVMDEYLGVPLIAHIRKHKNWFTEEGVEDHPLYSNDSGVWRAFTTVLRSDSSKNGIFTFFHERFERAASEQEDLRALTELIDWLETRKAVAGPILQEKFGVTRSCDEILVLLKEETAKLEVSQKLESLEQRVVNIIEQIRENLRAYEELWTDCRKRVAKRKKLDNKKDVGGGGEKESLEMERTDLETHRIPRTLKKVRDLKHDVSLSVTGDLSSLEAQKVALISLKKKLPADKESVESKFRNLEKELDLVEREIRDKSIKLERERAKNLPEFSDDEIAIIRPVTQGIDDFYQKVLNRVTTHYQDNESPYHKAVTSVYSDRALELIGNKIVWGESQQLLAGISMGSKEFILQSGDRVKFDRTSTGQGGAIYLSTVLRNALQEDKMVVAMFDEFGDLSEDSRGLVYDAAREYPQNLGVLLTASVENVKPIAVQKIGLS